MVRYMLQRAKNEQNKLEYDSATTIQTSLVRPWFARKRIKLQIIKHHTAAWDLQGELLAFSIDNLLCPNFVSAVQDDALHGSMGNWDTYEDLLFRKRS